MSDLTLIPKDDPHSQAVDKGWKEFKSKNEVKAATAGRDARLALLIMLIEGVNFGTLMADCYEKNDAKSWWSLAASAMTITSALFDLSSIKVKGSLANGSESISFQRIKLIGGVLSASATSVSIVMDFMSSEKEKSRGDDALKYLYRFKAAAGVANLGMIFASTFTYSAPLIKQLTGSAAAGEGVVLIGERATAVIAARILFMSVGAWVTVITFGVQVLIWVFSKDDLQTWCRLSPFGLASSAKEAYKSVDQQVAEMEKILAGMGFIEEKKKEYKLPDVMPTEEEMRYHD